MLRKILEDMFVPEEILNNITDDDKQLIFIEIRKEQIRRYYLWQNSDKSADEFHHKPNPKGKNIKFVDDNELVSFLGERPFDRPIEEILKEETFKRAQQEAEQALLAEFCDPISEKSDTQKNVDVDQGTDQVDNLTIHPTAEVASVIEVSKEEPPEVQSKTVNVRSSKNIEQKREEILKRKSREIYHNLLSQHSVLEEDAKKENEELTPIWEKVEEQARLDEEQRRKKALEARKFYANIGKEKSLESTDQNLSKAPATPTQKSSHLRYILSAISNFEIISKTGQDKSDIKLWFLENEWNKKKIVDKATNKVPAWFHGMISRQQTEKLLSSMEQGSFLIRVSEKCLCYVLSYKAKNKIKHILIQSKIECDQYEFLGPPNCVTFKSLNDLVTHFQNNFISDSNHDMLTKPCGQVTDSVVDYMSLIQPDSSQSDKKVIHKCSI